LLKEKRKRENGCAPALKTGGGVSRVILAKCVGIDTERKHFWVRKRTGNELDIAKVPCALFAGYGTEGGGFVLRGHTGDLGRVLKRKTYKAFAGGGKKRAR